MNRGNVTRRRSIVPISSDDADFPFTINTDLSFSSRSIILSLARTGDAGKLLFLVVTSETAGTRRKNGTRSCSSVTRVFTRSKSRFAIRFTRAVSRSVLFLFLLLPRAWLFRLVALFFPWSRIFSGSFSRYRDYSVIIWFSSWRGVIGWFDCILKCEGIIN